MLLPRTPIPCLRAARLLLELRDPQQLRIFAVCAEERAPHMAAPYLYEGVALQLLGDEVKAAERYSIYARLAPNDPRAREAKLVSRRLTRPTPDAE